MFLWTQLPGHSIIKVMFSGGRRRGIFPRIIAIIAISAILIGVICWVVFDLLKSAEISILFTPSDSEILVNGKRYKNGNFRMYPGEYKIEVNRDGFESQSLVVKLESNKVEAVHGWLEPSDGSMQIYTTSADDYNILRLVANDDKAIDFVNSFEKKRRIRDFLPVYDAADERKGASIKVSDGTTDEQCGAAICLIVETKAKTETAYNYMKNYFKSRGYNLDDYKIIYKKD